MEGNTPPSKGEIIVGRHGRVAAACGVFRAMFPALSVQVWKSWSTAAGSALKTRCRFASSYSGNTREVLSFFDEARKNGMVYRCDCGEENYCPRTGNVGTAYRNSLG